MSTETASLPFSLTDECAYWYGSSSGKLALAMPIVHPSTFGFSSADWTPLINLWLSVSAPSA
jgi:hypothetical protein